jgi:two-component system, NarL family, invasion response regulator UvrY
MIELLVVDDHAVVRQGIRQILAETSDIVVGADAVNPQDAVTHARSRAWDAILLDLALPNGDGLELLKQLRAEHPSVPILVLSMHPEDQFALRAIRAGASGYLTKNSAPGELVTAIRKVVGGGHYLSPWLAERLAREATGDPSKAAHEQLSDREYQVMLRIASGKTTKEIAADLNLSPKTVGTYRARLAKKMSLTTDAELTAYVFRNRLLE